MSLLAGLPSPAAAAPGGQPTGPSKESVRVGTGKSKLAAKSETDGEGVTGPGEVRLPEAASSKVGTSGDPVDVGGLDVSLSTKPPEDEALSGWMLRDGVLAAGPSSVEVTVADASVAEKAGVHGVVLSLSRTDGGASSVDFRLSVDYTPFAELYGADYGSRLHVVELPACVLSTPEAPECQVQRDLPSKNLAGKVSSDVSVNGSYAREASAPTVLAVTAGSSGTTANFKATSLSPAYSWNAGGQSGSFSWSYPLTAPDSLGGPSPSLALSYDSGSVDAQTLAQNGQGSWVGEGWDMQTGYIERSYRSCTQDGGTTADQCWFSPYNATMVFQGQSTKLVRDSATGLWKSDADSGMRIEQKFDTSLANGDNDGEYWVVTTMDGTQFWFGKNKRYTGDTQTTNSVQTVPVFGNNSGEPCYNTTFANAWCQQGYRWNLDYVVDPRGNSMTYFYTTWTGNYGLNNNAKAVPYVMSSTLDHIDYGTRAGSEANPPAPMQVWFTKTNRCTGSCTNAEYPDTPWDQRCTATTCPNLKAPAYWSPYKLSSVYTQIRRADGSGYRKVDSWDLTHTYPASGDFVAPAGEDTKPNLWLQTLTHTGYAEDGLTTLAEPAVTFGGTRMFNRVDWGNDIGVAPFAHYRLTSILNGVGGQTLISYSNVECSQFRKPMPGFNPYRCFPQYYVPDDGGEAGWTWFNKYTVTGVTEKDLTPAGSPDEAWTYTYSVASSSDASLWAHDFNETTQLAYRSWPIWRGYSDITTTHGPAGGTQTVSRGLYYRGMNGDSLATWDNEGMVWEGRRNVLSTPIGTPELTAPIGGGDGRCLDAVGGGTANGTAVQLYDCNGSSAQKWVYDSTVFTLKNTASGKCLDNNNNVAANGNKLQLWTCAYIPAQTWKLAPDGSLKSPVGKCIAPQDAGAVNNTPVVLWDCTGKWDQRWQNRSDDTLRSNQAQRCIDVASASTADAAKIQTWTCNGTTAQDWTYNTTTGALTNTNSGKCLDLAGGGTTAGTLIQQNTCNNTPGQTWKPQTDGSLKNPGSGRCLDATTSPAAGDQLILADCNGQTTSKWANLLTDSHPLAGRPREEFIVEDGTVTGSTIHTYELTQTGLRPTPSAGGQDLRAWRVNETDTKTRAWLPDLAGWRWSDKRASYDSYGLITQIEDRGDLSVLDDDTCTQYGYVRNVPNNLIGYRQWERTLTRCTTTPADIDVLSGVRFSYDGFGYGSAPVQGLTTKTESLAEVSAGIEKWKQDSRAAYDPYGRVVEESDALDRRTITAYTPDKDAPVVEVSVSVPMGPDWVTRTSIDPGRGLTKLVTDLNGKKTTSQYDALGRLQRGWASNRTTTATPDAEYVYVLGSPSSIETRTLGPNGNQVSSFEILDGRLRVFQKQEPTPVANGGRMIQDMKYDARGLVAKESSFYNSAAAPSATPVTFASADVQLQHRYTYDGLSRILRDSLYSQDSLKWETRYQYAGEKTTKIEPVGGATTQSIADAQGQTVELRYYSSSDLSSGFRATHYSYDRLGSLIGYTDPAGNAWSRSYDLRGRLITESDPDSGTTRFSYDDADQRLSATNGNNTTLIYGYDSNGRQTSESQKHADGTLVELATWTYDILASGKTVKGQVGTTTRYASGKAYTTQIDDFDDAYRPLGLKTIIPAGHGELSGIWATSSTYRQDGSPDSITYPAALGLAAESVTYAYDDHGFQLRATGNQTYVSETTFQPWGAVYQTTLGNAGKRVKVTQGSSPVSRRQDSLHVATENSVSPGQFDEQLSNAYRWDPAGNLTAIDDLAQGVTSSSQCFKLDAYKQIEEAWTTTSALGGCATNPTLATVGGIDPYWTSYRYDSVGNRVSSIDHGISGDDRTSIYHNPAAGTQQPHAVSSIDVAAGSQSSATSFTYDTAGATTKKVTDGITTDFTWNPTGSVDTITSHLAGGDHATQFIYAASGEKLLRTTPESSTLYLSGTEVTTNSAGKLATIQRSYICNGQVVATRTNYAPPVWQVRDYQGTARIAINSEDLVAITRKSDVFGNPRGAAVAWPDNRGFLGGSMEQSGLVYLGARLYDPSIGRFINPDKVSNAVNPQQANGYAYANNNPSTLSDPSGNDPGSTPDHITAVALRAQALIAAYPDAYIVSDLTNDPGPDLVCYGCKPGEVWVWEIKTENVTKSDDALEREVKRHVDQVEDDPLFDGYTSFVPGPSFSDLGLQTVQSGTSISSPFTIVAVDDDRRVPGLQIYSSKRLNWKDAQAKERTDRAIEDADKANQHAKKDGKAPKTPAQKARSRKTNLHNRDEAKMRRVRWINAPFWTKEKGTKHRDPIDGFLNDPVFTGILEGIACILFCPWQS
ncbi:hypothetical protein Afil01_44030 [Actinorhabdospora filicis]|uniref:Ricin B lectin domain-containing protein n=1 Tax=Actinorhabdospora filicis TaxID=1785913 RepID=A0A9W6WBI2_9ACTN|nr:hypothetical protein Afil01_44030 [Actinorhabdospora filicis]